MRCPICDTDYTDLCRICGMRIEKIGPSTFKIIKKLEKSAKFKKLVKRFLLKGNLAKVGNVFIFAGISLALVVTIIILILYPELLLF
jgi:hypothetical protein